MPDLDPVGGAADPVFIARPRRLRVIAIVVTILLAVLTVFGWYALPVSIRVLFTLSQRLTVLGVLAFLIVAMVAAAASFVRADQDGLVIRNGLRRHAVRWDRVHKILLRSGDPWALLLIKPQTGEFEVDLDADKRMLMGIQANDHGYAADAVEELRRRLQRSRRSDGGTG